MLSKFTTQILGCRPTFGSSLDKFLERSQFGCSTRFIKVSLFPFYTNLQLKLRLINLPHKFLGLYQHLDQISSNSENTFKIQQFCTVLLKQLCFPIIQTCSYYYAWQTYHTNSWVQTDIWVEFCRITRTFKIQHFCTVLLKQVCFPFIQTCSYYYAYQITHANYCIQTNVWIKFCQILRTFKLQQFCTVLIKQVCFPFI